MRTGLWFLLIGLLVSGPALSQRSDRAVVDAFESRIKGLARAIDTARTVQECAEISANIDALEDQYRPERDLLDKALYPDDFVQTMQKVRDRLKVRQADLGVVETQFARITELELRVVELTEQVTGLTAENVKLIADVDRLTQNISLLGAQAVADQRMIDSLRTVLKKLQQNLSARDKLIFALVDSIFVQYGKPGMDLTDLEKRGVLAKLERRDALTSIKRAIAENLYLLESTALKGSDFAEIARQQKAFQAQWQGLGPKLADVYYTEKRKKNELALVDSMLARWTAKTDERVWAALGDLFKEKGFVLEPFADGEQFTASFLKMMDAEVRNDRNEQSAVRMKLFTNFDTNLWIPELKTGWMPTLVETGKLTAGQVEQVEEKVEEWRRAVAGISWITYVLIAAIVGVLAWVILRLFVWKPKPAKQGG
jgi:cell division protein FtsB